MASCGERKKIGCAVKGYHIYKATCIWPAAITEELVCSREATNAANRYMYMYTKL